MRQHLGDWIVDDSLQSQIDPNVWQVTQEHSGRIVKVDDPGPADGLITYPGKGPIGVVTADCMPLVIVTPQAALALHVSRKSIIRGLLEAVSERIDTAYISGVYVGPHICPRHFVFDYVGEDIRRFREQFPASVSKSKTGFSLSLRAAVETFLARWSVPVNLVYEDGRCTSEELNLPSYRRSLDRKERTGEQLVTHVGYHASTAK